jgi:hypothetical protein
MVTTASMLCNALTLRRYLFWKNRARRSGASSIDAGTSRGNALSSIPTPVDERRDCVEKQAAVFIDPVKQVMRGCV